MPSSPAAGVVSVEVRSEPDEHLRGQLPPLAHAADVERRCAARHLLVHEVGLLQAADGFAMSQHREEASLRGALHADFGYISISPLASVGRVVCVSPSPPGAEPRASRGPLCG